MMSAAPFQSLTLLAVVIILLAATPAVNASNKKSGDSKSPKSEDRVEKPTSKDKSEDTEKDSKSEDTVKTPKTELVCDPGFGVQGSKCKECKEGEFSMGELCLFIGHRASGGKTFFWGSVHQCFFFLAPPVTVGQVPFACLAYPWTVTYIHALSPLVATKLVVISLPVFLNPQGALVCVVGHTSWGGNLFNQINH